MVLIILCAQFIKPAPEQSQRRMLSHVKDYSAQLTHDAAVRVEGFSNLQVVRSRQFWMLCAIFLPWMYCVSSTLVHIVIHAIGVGMSSVNAATIISIIGIAGIAARLIFGRLADTIGIKPVLIFSFTLFSFTFLWLLFAIDAWMLYLFAVMFGIAYATFELLQSPTIAKVFGLNSLGSISGLIFATSWLGIALGPVVTGHIFDITGSYQLAFTICVVMSCCSLISVILLRLTEEKV
jgi:MFS family permease